MNEQPHLVTTYSFKDRDYLIKMRVIEGNSLELSITDKYTTEDWQCSYDASYIETLTHKTGNYKKFDIFVTMLKSGLLKTSECITLDLLTYDDLEQLRSRRAMGRAFCTPRTVQSNNLSQNSSRRYLILTYTVEFDRIHYPLPLDYCGPPDPQILQTTIRRLEGEVARLQEQLKQSSGLKRTQTNSQITQLERRIEELTEENRVLNQELQYFKRSTKQNAHSKGLIILQNTVRTLEETVQHERSSFQKVIRRLREDKMKLIKQVEELTKSERSLKIRMQSMLKKSTSGRRSGTSRRFGDSQLPQSSRHPGDGLGSPGLRAEQCRSKTQPPSPSWHAKPCKSSNIKPLDELQCHITQSHNVDFQHLSARNQHYRSSSESSVGSRKHTILKYSKLPTDVIQTIAGKHFQENFIQPPTSRGRTRERNRTKTRSVSGSSAGSNAAKIKSTRRSSGSRHSSLSSSASCCRHSGGSDAHDTQPKQQCRKNTNVRINMSDLERRIHALQKVLKEGLQIK